MKYFKLVVKRIKKENKWGIEDTEVRKGIAMHNFKGKTDDTEFDIKEGDIIDYQHGTPVPIYGEDCELVSLTQIICQK